MGLLLLLLHLLL
jgi:hypothetical protein